MSFVHEADENNFFSERRKGREEVKKKFSAWDRLGKLNIPIDEFKAKTAYMWRDPTTWSYANLKDKRNNPLKCYYYQDKILNDKHRFIHVSAANQIGKSWCVQIKALHHAIHTDYGSVMLISRSGDQAKRLLDEIKWMMRGARMNLIKEFVDTVDNRFELHLKGPYSKPSVINVFPPTTAILGYPATLTILDETAFWEMDINMSSIEYYQQCIEPRSNDTKNWKHPFLTMGQIISITNPNGQDGLAWWLLNNPEFHNYRYNWLSNPNNTMEEYIKKKRTVNPVIFASTYAAEYVQATGGFISMKQYERFANYNTDLAIPPGELYLGADFASEDPKSKSSDWATLYAVKHVKNELYPNNPRIRVVYYKEWPPKTPREVIYNEIQQISKLSGVYIAKFGYDKVGVADSVQNDILNRGILSSGQIVPLSYSLPNKSEVYVNFQTLFLQNMIEGADIPKLKEELLALKVEKPTGSPHIKVHHKTEGVKDDHPDALANACYVAKQHRPEIYSKFVKGGSGGTPRSLEHKNNQFIEWIENNKAH